VKNSRQSAVLFSLVLLPLFFAGVPAKGSGRSVTDGSGRVVRIPKEIRRVVTVSDGLVEGVMTRLGLQDRIVGLGSRALQRTWEYTFETESGETFAYRDGMNPVRYLNPGFARLPLVADGPAVNMETLASLDPDLVIIRLGSCNLPGRDDGVRMTVQTLESLGFPLVVLEGPNTASSPAVSSISGEIRILGEVFGRQAEAEGLAAYLEEQVKRIRRRTRGIPEKEKVSVLLFGPSSVARKQGTAGMAFGLGTPESYFIETLANGRNAFRSSGAFRLISAEHLLALDPDVIVLCTAAGYHPPRELYEAPYTRLLRQMRAIRNRRVSALPWTPWNCEKRLEYPIDVMVIAASAYPDRFADVRLSEWLLDFYQNVYQVDRKTAEHLRSCQWMDWTLVYPSKEALTEGR
jgi:iron complex transport system substrate-binding protein